MSLKILTHIRRPIKTNVPISLEIFQTFIKVDIVTKFEFGAIGSLVQLSFSQNWKKFEN